MKVKLINYTPEPEKTIAMAAKLCYSPVGIDEIEKNLTKESIDKFLKMLTDLGHGSVFEHVSFTFAIEGISRACANQIVRHRIASYSQQSLRYVNMKNNFNYIMPTEINMDVDLTHLYDDLMEDLYDGYMKIADKLLENKMKLFLASNTLTTKWDFYSLEQLKDTMLGQGYKKEYNAFEKESIEDARSILPLSTETKIVATMNARSLFNFFEHRCCNRAQEEIRDLATEMLREVKKVAPILFDKAGASCVNGVCPEKAMGCGKAKEVREKFSSL
ncbi:FAD-dependent thymidylate synthase [Metaclostridioides mangenotii]|uniref:FAD-dependent thymidylate synthase n=1 Tax=Metaclostridioides mangenotii TaxID=1540 RepID=UPI000466A970|nr:FAD-dependent thymidylate synthase [Clostridioides mangenotii]